MIGSILISEMLTKYGHWIEHELNLYIVGTILSTAAKIYCELNIQSSAAVPMGRILVW